MLASPALLLPALVLLALLLRVVPWFANLPLHQDEALYGTWARAIADGSDPLLLIPWVDKPPLVLYLLGLSIRLFGASELSLRAPGMIAGLLTVWATFGLGRRVVGEKAALVAAALMALSPFAILFAPTAFTDGWLALFILAAAWAALARRPGWAGVLLGLACASKQQGVMAVPLVVGLVLIKALDNEGEAISDEREAPRARRVLGALGVAALGFTIIFGTVTYWDSLRWHNRPSYWDQSLQTYGGVVLAPLPEWPKRAGGWVRQAGYWFGAWPVTVAVLATAVVGRVGRLRINESRRMSKWSRRSVPLFLLAYVIGYLAVHLAFTFQPWDRYLLPVLPLACILCAPGLISVWQAVRARGEGRLECWAQVGASGLLVYAAALGVTASIPVGSDIGAYHGVAQAAEFLTRQPAGTTVYYDRIGWNLGYYLYGQPITRSWYDSPQKLASETARVAGKDASAKQWLALPRWEEGQLAGLRGALAVKGFVAEPAYQVTDTKGNVELTLYRMERAKTTAGLPARVETGP